jgi:hypothetical protein
LSAFTPFSSLPTHARPQPADEAAKLGERLENLIFALVDDHMFFKEIETFNELTIDALNQFDDGLDLRGYPISLSLSRKFLSSFSHTRSGTTSRGTCLSRMEL